MKKWSNIEAELKKNLAYKKIVYEKSIESITDKVNIIYPVIYLSYLFTLYWNFSSRFM